MIYTALGVILIIIGVLFLLRIITEPPYGIKSEKIVIALFLIASSITLGFGVHFLMLSLGI